MSSDKTEETLTEKLTQQEREALLEFLKTNRFPVALPSMRYLRLMYWAFCSEQSKTELAKNILATRIKESFAQINEAMEEYAALAGVGVEDIKASAIVESMSKTKVPEFSTDKWEKTGAGIWVRK